MMHDYHEALPGFDARRILHDGCGECEHRGESPEIALEHMDIPAFEKAWARAADWNRAGSSGILCSIGHAEAPTLRLLWLIQVQLERRGVPIGTIPGSGEPPF